MRKMPSNATQYMALARRRWKLFIIPAVLIPLLVFFIGRKLPRSYRSTSTVLIETQLAPKGLMDDSMQSDVKDRFESINNLIMSHTRLMHLVDQFGLYKLPGVSSREEAVAKLKKDLTVEIEGERVERQGSGVFRISYTASTPELAQDITREAANLSIDGNLQSREHQAEDNMVFIQDELSRAQDELQQKENRLNMYRSQHDGILPEQAASNLQLLSQTQTLALTNSEAIERADQQRVYVQSMLDADLSNHSSTAGTNVEAVDPQLIQKRNELRVARQRYTEKHPDVERLENEIKMLQQKPTQGSDVSHPLEMSTLGQRQLQSQLVAVQAELHTRGQRQIEIENKIRDLQGRAQVSPSITGELRELQSEYDAAQKNYNSLLEKQHSSTMTADLEKSRGHDLVKILDPASYPHQPSAPNLRILDLAGLGIGIMFGIMLALAVDLLDQTFHDQEDLITYLDVPVIATIPHFSDKAA